MKRYSIIHDLDTHTCLICGKRGETHIHEVFYGTANRQKSIQYGLCVRLCPEHHNASNEGVHFNKALDERLKKDAQKTAMQHYEWTKEEFIKIFGKNYLD